MSSSSSLEKPTDGQGPNTKLALEKARAYARTGNRYWTQVYIDRASDWSYITKDQLRYIQKLLDAGMLQALHDAKCFNKLELKGGNDG